ncbi:MAG TPA: 4-hydroxythreonine-4-phosphate dehydrogenase PdxA [Anaeromyxobacteraceae bacterium]|nr:4-hydroxythreonine-4-phosphate dehydrogenase PdxA [Anaeromyxobacteraceae bacterium]
MPTRIAISMGDPSGIGAEVTARALAALRGRLVPYVFGDAAAFARASRAVRLRLPEVDLGQPLPREGALVRVTKLPRAAAAPGKPSRAGGAAQLAYLQSAYAAVLAGHADALCTAPVSKAQVQRAEEGFVGHTEWLEARTGAKRSVMLLANRRLRVALVTNHLQLARVPRAVTPSGVLGTLTVTHTALRGDFGIARPRLALCAMNPHGGEGGSFGDEERRLLAPALARARRLGIAVSGPYPADSVFFRAVAGEFDAVIALYHDQGLIPVKLLDAVTEDPAVNVTLGLPIVRTSPDHGVAYDLAGKS